jgi:hypothetical protein
MAMQRGKYKFTLIDVTGIHNVAVQFCECDSRVKHRQQLMRACWWPATARDPSTCATFGVLRLFQNVNSLGKISSFHFLRSLELLSNADGLNPLPVNFGHSRCRRRLIVIFRTDNAPLSISFGNIE